MHGLESICINFELWALGLAADSSSNKSSKERNKLQSSSLPSILCCALRNVLDGNNFVYIFICISLSEYNAKESKFSLEYGDRLSKLRINPKVSANIDV